MRRAPEENLLRTPHANRERRAAPFSNAKKAVEARVLRQAIEDTDREHQHGPVRVIMKDGKRL
jgi:hypothetical protein